jgi:hypothetical protein
MSYPSYSNTIPITKSHTHGFSSGQRDKVKKPSANDRHHSTESVSNPFTGLSSIVHTIDSEWPGNTKLNAADTAAER